VLFPEQFEKFRKERAGKWSHVEKLSENPRVKTYNLSKHWHEFRVFVKESVGKQSPKKKKIS